MPADDDTILIKRGLVPLNPAFQKVADRIQEIYGVRPLNIIYHPADGHRVGPSLYIYFDHDREKALFMKDLFSPHRNHVARILTAFRKYAQRNYETRDLKVWFESFESQAKSAARAAVSERDRSALHKKLNHPYLWKIFHDAPAITFFTHTTQQADEIRDTDLHRQWSAAYYALLSVHDEFGYFQADTFQVALDNKENLDQNYAGSFFYYTR
jgi:hypothetical protein